MRDLTLILPYYRNPQMLGEQQRVWRSYSADLRWRLHVVVVDDGSPKFRAEKALDAECPIASVRLYRCGVDVRWNWLFCRNLGVQEATTEWVFLTDIDHVIPEWTLRRILDGPLDARCVYRFARVDAPLLTPTIGKYGEDKAHPNTWLMTRAMFDRIGGYDERFSGWYGTDGEFRDRVQQRARAVVLLPEPIIQYSRDVIPDASTTAYDRKTAEDRANVARIRDERANEANRRPLRVTFPYERLR